MAATTPDKSELRTILRQLRRDLSENEQKTAAGIIAGHAEALPQWRASRHIALYTQADGEVDTGPIAALCRAQGKKLYLPVIDDAQQMEFACWSADQPLQLNRFGISQPRPDAGRRPPTDLDIIFIPLVGWDRAGNRLGMGGGYYDRLLSGISGPLLAGLAHGVQEVECVPVEKWDIALNIVVTEAGTQICTSGASAWQ